MCGGNMFLIKRIYIDYIYGNINPKESFFATSQEPIVEGIITQQPLFQGPFEVYTKMDKETVINGTERAC